MRIKNYHLFGIWLWAFTDGDVSLFLGRSHNGKLRWSEGVEYKREKYREEKEGKGDGGTVQEAHVELNHTVIYIAR